MNNFILRTGSFLLVVFVLFSCNSEFGNIDCTQKKEDLSRKDVLISKAQSILLKPKTRALNNSNMYLCTDFIPFWDETRYSKNSLTETVDVDICTNKHFIALQYKDKAKKYVNVSQMLTITMDNTSKNIVPYLATFIPDENDFNLSTFYTSGDKGDYSGLVIYTLVDNSTILMINKYKKGVKIDSVNIFTSDFNEIAERQKRMSIFLSGIYMLDREFLTKTTI